MNLDTPSREPLPETAALLNILELGVHQIETAKVEPAAIVIARLRRRQPARPRLPE